MLVRCVMRDGRQVFQVIPRRSSSRVFQSSIHMIDLKRTSVPRYSVLKHLDRLRGIL